MPTPYGQFGTPGYFSQDIPLDVVQQYPGTQNIKQAGQMYGNLLYGPLSKGYQVASAQTSDPTAQAFQQETGSAGGGAFAPPGAGTLALSNLFGGLATGNVAGQKAQQQQQDLAAQGMYNVANTYAQDIYQTQSAANQLAQAKAEQQQQEQQGIMSLLNMFTSPTGLGANILGPGGTNTLNAGQSPFGGIFSALSGAGTGMAGPAGAWYGAGAGPFSVLDSGVGAAGDWFGGTGIDAAVGGAGAAGGAADLTAFLPDLFGAAAAA